MSRAAPNLVPRSLGAGPAAWCWGSSGPVRPPGCQGAATDLSNVLKDLHLPEKRHL